MILDGRRIAAERIAHMRDFVVSRDIHATMMVFAMVPDAATLQYLRIKEKVGERIGIPLHRENWPASWTTQNMVERIREVSATQASMVLQLPFQPSIDLSSLLQAIPEACDPDRMGVAAEEAIRDGRSTLLAPVVSAIRLILRREHISATGLHVVVVGQGRLVGAPASEWFVREGARVTSFTRESGVDPHIMRTADIVVLGAGVPEVLTPSMLKDGSVIFDAGTSEEGGRVVGDADPRCAERAKLFTPVPGGIGPIAVAELFSNMLALQHGYTPPQ